MASSKSLQVEVALYEGRLWRNAAASVQFPTIDGSLGVSSGRQLLLAQLNGGTVTASRADKIVSFQAAGGFASIDSDLVMVVADHAIVAER